MTGPPTLYSLQDLFATRPAIALDRNRSIFPSALPLARIRCSLPMYSSHDDSTLTYRVSTIEPSRLRNTRIVQLVPRNARRTHHSQSSPPSSSTTHLLVPRGQSISSSISLRPPEYPLGCTSALLFLALARTGNAETTPLGEQVPSSCSREGEEQVAHWSAIGSQNAVKDGLRYFVATSDD